MAAGNPLMKRVEPDELALAMQADVTMIGSMALERSGTRSPTGEFSREAARRIHLVRVARGLARSDVDTAAGLARGLMSKIESGSRGRWLSIDIVAAIAQVLNVDVGWLITGKVPKKGWAPPPGLAEAAREIAKNPKI